MTCMNTAPSKSNTLKNLVVNSFFHYSYIQREVNDKKKMIINIFSSYVVPLLKDSNHPALIKEWKINIDAAAYKKIWMLTWLKLLKKIDRHDSYFYCPTTTKDTIQWFPFLTILEHTANIRKPKQGLINSLLKVFATL